MNQRTSVPQANCTTDTIKWPSVYHSDISPLHAPHEPVYGKMYWLLHYFELKKTGMLLISWGDMLKTVRLSLWVICVKALFWQRVASWSLLGKLGYARLPPHPGSHGTEVMQARLRTPQATTNQPVFQFSLLLAWCMCKNKCSCLNSHWLHTRGYWTKL